LKKDSRRGRPGGSELRKKDKENSYSRCKEDWEKTRVALKTFPYWKMFSQVSGGEMELGMGMTVTGKIGGERHKWSRKSGAFIPGRQERRASKEARRRKFKGEDTMGLSNRKKEMVRG